MQPPKLQQKCLALSKFLNFLEIEIQLPMTIQCDNQGTIFLSKNESSTQTKHADVKYYIICELVEANII